MPRKHNTNKDGGQWTDFEKLAVWQKGKQSANQPSNLVRIDQCGDIMLWSEYGKRESDHGWEIDHINPVSNGGGDALSNLQPLNWKNNASKGDKLNWRC